MEINNKHKESDVKLKKNVDLEQVSDIDSEEEKLKIAKTLDLFETFQCRLTSKHPAITHNVLLSLNSQNNKIELNDINDLYMPLKYSSSYPTVCPSSYENIKTDPSMQLVTDKITWKNKARLWKSTYKKIPRNRQLDSLSLRNPKATIPLYLYNFTKLMQEDPDPYFDSNHNWYYSGNGNISSIEIDNVKYMLYSITDTLFMKKIGDVYNSQFMCKYTLPNKQLIYETICTEFSDKLIVGLRQKFRISLLQIVESDNLNLECFAKISSDVPFVIYHCKTIPSNIPFVSFFIDQHNNCVIYSCADGSVYSYNLESEKTSDLFVISHKKEILNNWSSVQKFSDDVLLYTNMNSINILDVRSNKTKNSLVDLSNCDRLSMSKKSIYDTNSVYVSSAHNVLLYDFRFISKRNGFQKQWTHGLKSTPLFMCNAMWNHEEFLHISGASSGESCVIINPFQTFTDDLKELQLQQCTYPWHPLSILDSYKKILLKGICLDPTLNARNRVNASICGSMFSFKQNELNLFKINSFGDIFVQEFFNTIYDIDKESNLHDSFSHWSNHLCCVRENKFAASSIVDFSVYYEKLKKHRRYNDQDIKKKRKNLLVQSTLWKNSLEYFSQCKDMCSQELLHMWGFIDEKEMQPISNLSQPHIKVEDWIDKMT